MLSVLAPSIVPAAKLCPMAGTQPLTSSSCKKDLIIIIVNFLKKACNEGTIDSLTSQMFTDRLPGGDTLGADRRN